MLYFFKLNSKKLKYIFLFRSCFRNKQFYQSDLNQKPIMASTDSSLTQSLITQDASYVSNPTSPQKVSKHQKNNFQTKIINGSSILSNVFFTWIYSFLRYGSKNFVNIDRMPKLSNELKTDYDCRNLKEKFEMTERSKKQGMTLTKALFKTYIYQFAILLGVLVVYVFLSMFNPFLTAMIMKYIGLDPSEKDINYGGILFGLTLLTTFIKCLAETHLNYRFTLMGINITNSLTMMIYEKSLKYASLSEKQFSQSDIINYSQVDAQRMTYMGYQLAAILVVPFQIVAGIIMMYNFIGVSFVSGIGAMIIMIFCTFLTSKRAVRYNQTVLKVKDERMKVTQEMLDIIRYIKINAIQKFFFRKVDQKRSKEIQYYKKKGLMDVLNIFIYWLACPVILSATFYTYIAIGNQMSSQVAFTTIMIFTTLQYPIRLLPNCISEVIQIYASIKRIQKFLLAEQLKTDHIIQTFDNYSPFAIKIERGDFYWGLQAKKDESEDKKQEKKQKKEVKKKVSLNEIKDDDSLSEISETTQNSLKQIPYFTKQEINNIPSTPTQKADQKIKYIHALKDINTTIQRGKFTILIGDIGSGKSSFLLAILNEMRTSSKTRIQINGSIAYASQKPWIMSDTVKNNIVFSETYDERKFNEVIHYASLEHDIKILPKGVETQIGEKGVNLSGGQKARISLARALYSQKQIYLLDDILSAVDVHVGEFLMKQTLLGYLKDKTIIMPTHAIKFSEFVDEVIIMRKGRIVRKGNYRDINDTKQFIQISLKQMKKQANKQVDNEDKKLSEEYDMLKEVMKSKSKNETHQIKHIQDQLIQQLMLPQDHVIGSIDLKIFKQYIQLNGGYFRFAFLVSFAMLLWIISTTFASIIMERWCEDPTDNNYQLYIYMSLSIFSNLFIFFRAYTLVRSGAKQGERVHRGMMKSLLYASLSNFYNRVPVGRIINRLTKDLRELDQAIAFAIGNVLVNFFSLLSTLTICIYGSTPLILIPIAIVVFFSNVIRNFYMKTQRQVARLEKSTNSPIVSGYISAISGLSVIRAYQKQSNFTENQMKFIDINKKVRLNKSALECWFSLSLTYLSFIVNMSAIGYCILSSNENASLAGLLMNYALSLSSDIIGFIMSIATFETKIVCLQRIYTFMKIPAQPAYNEYCLDWKPEQEGYEKVIKEGQIQFHNTCVKYRKDLPLVLKQLNLTINKGEKIGIVGRTGAGKTTIINTLLRLTDIAEGDVFIDGKSISNLTLKDLRNGITMIDQEPTLIKSTFKQNLDITGRYTEEELLNILRQCNLFQTITEKGGLEGKVSNDSLSVGEKQLLCICRAFLKQSKIVLIDEATANIDMKNDEIIQRVIQQKFKDCTVLTIAHRLSTLKNSDKILVMENGRILEYGRPEQLQRSNGFYQQMLEKNASQFLV